MTSTLPVEQDARDAAQVVGATDLYQNAEAIASASIDAVVDTRAVDAVALQTDSGTALALIANTPQGAIRLALNDGAHRQLAEKVGIPYDYYRRMLASQVTLLTHNLNTWLHAEPERHMLRMLRPITEDQGRDLAAIGGFATIRAVLSSRYRVLDNLALLNVLLPEAAARGLMLRDAVLTDTRFSLRFTGEELSLAELMARQGLAPSAARAGEVLSLGTFVRNSETGHSSLSIEPFARILACVNGLIVSKTLRAIHVGRDKEDGFLSDQTRRVEDAAVFLKVRDRFIEATAHGPTAKLLHDGMSEIVTPALPMFEFVGNVGTAFNLTKAEVAILQDEVVQDAMLNPTPGLTRFNVSQGMTALARRVYETTADDERRADLERIGWQIIENPVEALLKAGREK